MVTSLIVISIIVVGLVLLFSIALASAAGWADSERYEGGPLATLGALRSPNGRPFFANSRAAKELVEAIADLDRSGHMAVPPSEEPAGRRPKR